jgi:hypothetical protein
MSTPLSYDDVVVVVVVVDAFRNIYCNPPEDTAPIYQRHAEGRSRNLSWMVWPLNLNGAQRRGR